MKVIKYEDLKTIIDFIYKGEANVAANNTDRFLKTAQELQIKGLATEEAKIDEVLEFVQEEEVIIETKQKKKTISKEVKK